jgi:hypothetical protein
VVRIELKSCIALVLIDDRGRMDEVSRGPNCGSKIWLL